MKVKAPKVLLAALALGAGIAVTLALLSASRQGAPPTPPSLAPARPPHAVATQPASASPSSSVARFPTHVDLVTEDPASPTRESFPKAREIPVTGSTELGCSTKFAEPYLMVDCGPGAQPRTPRDLAVVRGIVTKTWVTADHLGFIARLESEGGVTVGLGWDDFSRVVRIHRPKGKHGRPRGEVLSAEGLIVMASEEAEPQVHYFGFEVGHEIEYTIIIQHDGCSRRVLRGSGLGGYPNRHSDSDPTAIGDVESYIRPGDPVVFFPNYSRNAAYLEERHETRPPGLQEECLAVQEPPLRARLWPLRPGDPIALQPTGSLLVPSEAEFDRAHPRASIIRGADAHACVVARVRDFFRLRCDPSRNFGAARGIWLVEGSVLAERREGRRLELVLAAPEGRVRIELIWEKASLALSAFARQRPGRDGTIEPSTAIFYAHQAADQAIVLRAVLQHSAADLALDFPPEVRNAFAKFERWEVDYHLVTLGRCASATDGYAAAEASPWGAETAASMGRVPGASAQARHYYTSYSDLRRIIAVEPGGMAIWFRQVAPEMACFAALPRLRRTTPQKVLELEALQVARRGQAELPRSAQPP